LLPVAPIEIAALNFALSLKITLATTLAISGRRTIAQLPRITIFTHLQEVAHLLVRWTTHLIITPRCLLW
jgi:hypothetical protein